MPESQPGSAEAKFEPVVPIYELVNDISEADADLITQIAGLDERLSKISDELRGMVPWALDQAFLHPHGTAQMLREPGQRKLRNQALQLATDIARSGIAYRVSANPKLSWMARITDDTYTVLREDRIFRDRKDKYSREPNAPWLYKEMQSRLFVCLARMMEGKEMEVRRIHPLLRQRIAAKAMELPENSDDI
jgi:hypothetical protein